MSFVIPSIFTAVDKFSSPISKMSKSVNRLASNVGTLNNKIGISEQGIARHERLFNRLTPVLNEGAKQMLSYAKAAALAGGAFAIGKYSVDQVVAFEDALASFRTIVSELSDKEFAKYNEKIFEVARKTKKSSVEVANAFETIAGLNAKLAETPEALSAATEASITLAKASRMDLADAAGSLVEILNQYNLGAEHSSRVTNVLAAGLKVGAASISEASESYKNFGSVAAAANISLEQSQALIQLVSQKGLKGAEAGTKLRGSILKLQQAGVGYQSGQFQVRDALIEVEGKLNKLRTAKERDALITKLFGAENISTGQILLKNINTIDEFTKAITGTNEAQIAASTNSNTLTSVLNELKAKWTNIITESNGAGQSLNQVKDVLRFVTDNMETLLKVGVDVVKFLVFYKGLILGAKAALFLWNVYLGLNAALTSGSALAIGSNAVAITAYNIATKAAAAAQWLWNAALTANPIGLVIVAVAALVGLIVLIINKWDSWGETFTAFLGIVSPGLSFIINLIQSIRRNWDMITEAFSKEGIVSGLKAIGKTILDAILSPLQKILEVAGKLPGKIGELARSGAASLKEFREGMGVSLTQNPAGAPPEKINPRLDSATAMQVAGASPNGVIDLNINNNTPYQATAKASGTIIGDLKMQSTLGGWQYSNS